MKRIHAGLSRSSIHARTGRVSRWAVGLERVSPDVDQALWAVAGLHAGRHGARQPEPGGPDPARETACRHDLHAIAAVETADGAYKVQATDVKIRVLARSPPRVG